MQFKTFTRLFLLIGMIGWFSASAFADEIQIGSGTQKDYNIPTQSNYNYSLTQQIYTAEEIENAGGSEGTISSIAFYNDGTTKTRTWDIYLVNTGKDEFTSASDWITVTNDDKVFSGSVTLTAGTWTSIPLSSFNYSGGNLAVVVDDNTNSCSYGLGCLIYTDPDSKTRCLYGRDDNTNYNPLNPTSNGNGYITNKNQIKMNIEPAAVSCAKPKNFDATGITAHTATLTWTAGADSQSNWEVYITTTETNDPGENPSPTYQVMECTKALTDLTAQTSYYAFVRSNCGGTDGNSKWAKKVFTTTREALAVDATHSYSQSFESGCDWGFTNGDRTNKWCWGNATNNGGTKAMYISNDNGTSNAYTLNSTTVVYASKLFAFEQGTYTFVFDWKAYGESGYSEYDYLRVALIPGDVDFTAGTSLPSGLNASSLPSSWIALDGEHQLNKSSDWQSQTAETAISGTYTMVFIWRNDSGSGENPPAAIDNINISMTNCPRPSDLTANGVAAHTATLTWAGGEQNAWEIYLTDSQNDVPNDASRPTYSNVSSNSYGLTALDPETDYYAYVRTDCGDETSAWSDVCHFKTTVACVKPTSLNTSNITINSVMLSWTAGEGQDSWEISICESTSSHPETDGTLYSVTNNPCTINGLTPDKMYYAYVRANCGDVDGLSQWSTVKSFTTLATCIKPTSFSANNVTATSAKLTWTAGEVGQSAWNVMYKKSSDSEWITVPVTETELTLNNLSPITTYYAKVQADCGDGDLSKWAETSFDTQCGELSLPYFYDFESNVPTGSSYPMPKCWERIQYVYQYSTYYPYVFTATMSYPYAHGGNGANSTTGKSLRFYKSSSTGTETAVLPAIEDGYQMKDIQIRFWARSTSTNQTISIGIMTSPTTANTFTEVLLVEGISTTFTEFTVPLSSYEGNGRYIAIRCGTGSGQPIFIDDITVEVIPTCLVPSNLAESEVGVNNATLTWTPRGNETAWNVQYKKVSESEWSNPIAVDETTYTLNGLQRATEYEVRVQANCSTDDQSDWTNPISFTTECGIWPIDAHNGLFEDFENVNASDFPPICWEKFSHEMSGYTYWYLNSNNGLGSSAAFSYWNEGYAFLVMPLMHIDGNAILSFDHLISDGSYNGNCSVVVSTETMTYDNFSTTIWEGNGPTSGKASETVSLSAFNGQDIYIAFKYKGAECTWYIDNVQVYVPITQTVELAQGWNWFSTCLNMEGAQLLQSLEQALGNNGVQILSQNDGSLIYEDDEWDGELHGIISEKMYMIQASANCTINLSGVAVNPASHSITICNGYNWIGFPSSQSMTLEAAFVGFEPEEGDQIISFDGSAIYEDDEWDGDLTTLQPGKGYIYISHAANNKTLTFGTNSNK